MWLNNIKIWLYYIYIYNKLSFCVCIKKNELYNVFSFFQCFLIILQHLTPIDAQECINSPSSDLLSLTLSYYSSYREKYNIDFRKYKYGL